MTAAHCIEVNDGVGNPTDADSVFPVGEMIFLGANMFDGTDSEFASTVAEVVVHPDWDFNTDENDIALVRLAQATTITPATLNTDSAVPAVADAVTVIGFGDTDPDSGLYLQTIFSRLP